MAYVYDVTAQEYDNTTATLGSTALNGSPKVSVSSIIRYIVKIYESDGTTRYSDTGVSVHWGVVASQPKNITWEDYFKGKGMPDDLNFVADISGKGPSTIAPTFTVEVNGNAATLQGSIATPIFTLATVTTLPTVPSQITADLVGTKSTTNDVYYNPCPDAVNNVGAAEIKTLSGLTYNRVIKFYKKDGSAGATATPCGTDYKKVLQYLLDFKSGIFCPSNRKAITGSSSFNTTAYTGPRWNPPNHKGTRGDSHGERTAGGHAAKDTRLGYIYSNTDYKSSTLNKPVLMSTTGKSPIAANAAWGFRFHYNPGDFSYNTSVMEGLNIESIQIDPSNIIPGNTNITLGLVLNRQLDTHLLDPANPERSKWASHYETSSVRGSLTEDQLNNFWTRGTEYDLEFFYRIVSAMDPTKRTLLTNGDITSDLGFVTVQPFWLTLHDNMNYFVKLQNISVFHRAFTKNMVPYLTEVTLTMTRMMTPELNVTDIVNKTTVSYDPRSGLKVDFNGVTP